MSDTPSSASPDSAEAVTAEVSAAAAASSASEETVPPPPGPPCQVEISRRHKLNYRIYKVEKSLNFF